MLEAVKRRQLLSPFDCYGLCVTTFPRLTPLKSRAKCCSLFEAVGLFVSSLLPEINRFRNALVDSFQLCFAAKLRQHVAPCFSMGFWERRFSKP